MTQDEFNKRLDILLSDDEISDKEIKADINNMVEALLKSKVEAITDKDIDNEFDLTTEKLFEDKVKLFFIREGARWFKNQLLKQ